MRPPRLAPGDIEFEKSAANILRQIRNQAPRRCPVGEGGVLPQMAKHLQKMRFAATVKTTYPCGLLAGLRLAAKERFEYSRHTVAILTFADEALQVRLVTVPASFRQQPRSECEPGRCWLADSLMDHEENVFQ